MGSRLGVRRFAPGFARAGYRDVRTAWSVLRSPNRRFVGFVPPGHYASPLPHVDAVGDALVRDDEIAGVDLREADQLRLLDRFAAFAAELPFPEHPDGVSRYHLDNEWFSYGDAVALYSMMRAFRPKRIVEVGSGFSSAVMLDVRERFLDGDVDLTFVEPYPHRLHDLLTPADAERTRLVVEPVQEVDLSVFDELGPDDVLFIDSSHVAKAGSDVNHLFFRVLPRLAPGVLVHVHDIPWPFEYPQSWFDEGRAWNEAYLLRALLQHNAAFEVVFYGAFLAARHPEALARALPAAVRTPSTPNTLGNSSIWLRRTA